MRLFNKDKTPEPIETPIIDEPTPEPEEPEFKIGTHRIRELWDNKTASIYYSLEEYGFSRSYIYGGYGKKYTWTCNFDGDYDWAKRQADHYNIEIIPEDKK